MQPLLSVIPAFPAGNFKISDPVFETFKVKKKKSLEIDYPVSLASLQADQWFEENTHPHSWAAVSLLNALTLGCRLS